MEGGVEEREPGKEGEVGGERGGLGGFLGLVRLVSGGGLGERYLTEGEEEGSSCFSIWDLRLVPEVERRFPWEGESRGPWEGKGRGKRGGG